MESIEDLVENLSLEQLDELIDLGWQAAARVDVERRLRFTCLSMLISSLRHRTTRTSSEEHFNEMIEYLKIAKQIASSEDPERIPMNCFLATVLFSRYQCDGQRDNLLEAIETVEIILPEMAAGHQLQSISSKLGDMYWDRYQLDQDIQNLKLAVEKTPNTNPSRRYRLSTLSNCLYESYKNTNNKGLLAEAILYGGKALGCARGSPSETNVCLFFLGDMQFSKFKLSRARNDVKLSRIDIDLSVEYFKEAAELLTPNDVNGSAIVAKLGDVLGYRFEITKRQEDIDNAIGKLERAVELKEGNDPTLRDTLKRLYFLLFTRFQTAGDNRELERALYHAERILATTPEQGPYRAGDLHRVGHLHLDLFY